MCERATTVTVVAHLRSRARHRMIVAGRRSGPGGCRPDDERGGSTLDLAPQIARSRRGFREHPRCVLELPTRHPVTPKHHPPTGILHRDVERGVGLDAPELTERTDERGVGDAETWGVPIAAGAKGGADESENDGQAGAYHAGKARRHARAGQRRAILA